MNRLSRKLSRLGKAIAIQAWRILVVLDMLLNVLLLGRIETLSDRMGRHVLNGRCRGCKAFCRLLDLIDKDHCTKRLK